MPYPLLIYPPFCTPASPPYSLTNLNAKMNNKCTILDLNILFHNLKFPKFKQYYQQSEWNDKEYNQITKEYTYLSSKCYSENNKKVLHKDKPEYFEELLGQILSRNPSSVAFSIVYSSQAFYAYALIKELKRNSIRCFVGGPAVTHQLAKLAETDLSEFFEQTTLPLDFSIYNPKDYFTPKLVIPLKTCTTCAYQQCTFCTHHQHSKYVEFDLEWIYQSIIKSKAKYFFFIDDMITTKRLLQLADKINPLKIKWMCQLRPTKDLSKDTLKKMYDSGLRTVLWGIESGSNRILNLMKKGTNQEDITTVLQNAHELGIKNVVYVMFGFPTETKLEFLETVSFLEQNKENIDLLSISNFGLQSGTPIFDNPTLFGIDQIKVKPRNLLDPKVEFTVKEGLNAEELSKLRKEYRHKLSKINKLPQGMNFFREHVFN